jgi:hypothetical protein
MSHTVATARIPRAACDDAPLTGAGAAVAAPPSPVLHTLHPVKLANVAGAWATADNPPPNPIFCTTPAAMLAIRL